MKILLTGSSGFMGRNILPFLEKKHCVFAPKRSELDVRNSLQVKEFLEKGMFDVVVHFASPSPVRSGHLDSYETLFEDSLRIFMNFYTNRHLYGKMIYSGSGAEYDKRRDITFVTENEIGNYIPEDAYGLSKYVINELASKSQNIINLRIFACYGPHEYDSKFITHAINCCMSQKPITIRQDCYFDYLHVNDYARYLLHLVENTPRYSDYNAVSGMRVKLSEIAEIVNKQMDNAYPVEVLTSGLNKEYTADNQRVALETGIEHLISLEYGIKQMIKWKKAKDETTNS